MNKKLIELFGWYGTVAIVAAYALASFSLLSPKSTVYQMLNLSGALAIVLLSVNKKAYQPAVLNIIWSIVALLALLGNLVNLP